MMDVTRNGGGMKMDRIGETAATVKRESKG